MSELVQAIDDLLLRKPLLTHPFYLKWSKGTLTLDSLAGYAREYYAWVEVVPLCVGDILSHAPVSARHALLANQAEEHSHIALWRSFGQYLCQVTPSQAWSSPPSARTEAVVSRFRALCSGYHEGAAAMYAFEKALPEISKVKLEGLRDFYGITDEVATTYFEVHAIVDILHAKSWAKLLEEARDTDTLYKIAEASLEAQHALLDICDDTYA